MTLNLDIKIKALILSIFYKLLNNKILYSFLNTMKFYKEYKRIFKEILSKN